MLNCQVIMPTCLYIYIPQFSKAVKIMILDEKNIFPYFCSKHKLRVNKCLIKASSNEYHNLCFRAKKYKKENVYLYKTKF